VGFFGPKHLARSTDYPILQGTSFAAALVAGEAALVWNHLGSTATNGAVRQRIEDTCVPGEHGLTHKTEHGTVDFFKAVSH
jgi:subtilisin family serine protease